MERAGFVNLYPLRFNLTPQTMPWAGHRMGAFSGAAASAPSGVWWGFVDDGELQSTVAAGPLAGKTLRQLCELYPADLVGRKFRGQQPLPLAVRFLDIGANLPLLVHPDEAYCATHREFKPNTKFWYCLDADPAACVMVGIGQRVTGAQILQHLNTAAVRDLLQQFPACPGDSFLVPAGRVHSATAGVLLLDVQQRHVEPLCVSSFSPNETVSAVEQEQALRAVHYEDRQVGRISREASSTSLTRKIPLVRYCPFFTVEELRIAAGERSFDATDGKSFHLLVAVREQVNLESRAGRDSLSPGTVCCVPATFGGYWCAAAAAPAALLRIKLQQV